MVTIYIYMGIDNNIKSNWRLIMWNSDKEEHRTMIPVGGQYDFATYASLIKHDDSWFICEAKYYEKMSKV